MQHGRRARTGTVTRSTVTVVGILVVLGSCGARDARDTAPTLTDVSPTTVAAAGPAVESATSAALEQPAVWPAAGVVFTSPDAAARDFVQGCYVLGPFQQRGPGSGEIDVFSAGESCSGPASGLRSRLLMRQLGPARSWFITEAVSTSESITVPAAGSRVAAGRVTVKGLGSGFEGTVNVAAFKAGNRAAGLDHALTHGAASGPPTPFTVTLDLSGASPGDVVTLEVVGDSGIGDGPFAAIPIVLSPGRLIATL